MSSQEAHTLRFWEVMIDGGKITAVTGLQSDDTIM